MRKEADDTGPLAELEYWKQRTAKFSCLVDQIKTQPCRGVITTLAAAKSKIIKVIVITWLESKVYCDHYKLSTIMCYRLGENLTVGSRMLLMRLRTT